MSEYICGKCRKSRDQLIEEGKLNLVQGYEQCADCGGDLDHKSVFEIEDIRANAQAEAIKNNDYLIMEPSLALKRMRGDEAKGTKVPNSHKYYPQWYQDHLREGLERTNKMMKEANDYSMYNKVIE